MQLSTIATIHADSMLVCWDYNIRDDQNDLDEKNDSEIELHRTSNFSSLCMYLTPLDILLQASSTPKETNLLLITKVRRSLCSEVVKEISDLPSNVLLSANL